MGSIATRGEKLRVSAKIEDTLTLRWETRIVSRNCAVISWPPKPFLDPFPKDLNGQLTASFSLAGIELDAVVETRQL
jgi:hypothetical protein